MIKLHRLILPFVLIGSVSAVMLSEKPSADSAATAIPTGDCECPAGGPADQQSGCATISWPMDLVVDDGECDKPGCGEVEPCAWRSPSEVDLVISCPSACGYYVCDWYCTIGGSCSPVCNFVASNSIATDLPIEIPCGYEFKRTITFYDCNPASIGYAEITRRCIPCIIE